METLFASRTRSLMSRISAFLVVVAVVAALVGCVEGPDREYVLTISATEGGSVTDPGMGPFTYEFGEAVSLVAAADQGYQFVKWTGDVRTVDDVESAETTVTVRADYSITASFEPAPIVHFDLTVSSTAGGFVTAPGEGTFTYDADTVVDLIAVADECYEFTEWTGDTEGIADPNSPSTTISITIAENEDKAVTACFARLRYELTLSSTPFGSVTAPGEGTFTFNCGDRVNLVASAGVRSRFIGWKGDVAGIDDPNAPHTMVHIDRNVTITARFEVVPMITAGIWHTVGLKSDGTVVATGYNAHGQCDVGEWTNIVQVAAGERHTIGLSADGTVIAAGGNDEGECDVEDWTDIVQVDCGRYHTVGLRADGTLVAVGRDDSGRCDVDGWTEVVQVAAGFYHTLGLRADGTVMAVGPRAEGRLEVGGWVDVVQVGAGGHHSLGLRSDGMVIAVGRDNYGETQLDDWADILQVAGGCQASVGLRSNGTVVQSGWCSAGQCLVGGWSNIIQVDAGILHTVGLRADGTVVTAGSNTMGQRNVHDWVLG